MCKGATIIPREKSPEDQSQMLCNVIVRATHELHVNQGKNEDDVENFLHNDCQQLPTNNLRQKVNHLNNDNSTLFSFHQCKDLLDKYGKDIYRNVVNNMVRL